MTVCGPSRDFEQSDGFVSWIVNPLTHKIWFLIDPLIERYLEIHPEETFSTLLGWEGIRKVFPQARGEQYSRRADLPEPILQAWYAGLMTQMAKVANCPFLAFNTQGRINQIRERSLSCVKMH